MEMGKMSKADADGSGERRHQRRMPMEIVEVPKD
jgi:hypothetical protein